MSRFFLFFALISTCHLGAQPSGLLFETQHHVQVNNRILATVNGHPISVYDVMKKMDMIFYRQFPEYASSAEARFQFYNINWKQVLEDLIQNQLMLADAEQNKLEVTNSDVRQEMENMFGPNIVENLDKIGMSYDEAWNLIKRDLTIRRTQFIRATARAVRRVTPLKIREAHAAYAEAHVNAYQWRYRVITVRGDDATVNEQEALKAHTLLTSEDVTLEELENQLPLPEGTTVSISSPYEHGEDEVSAAYKEVLAELKEGNFSTPVAQYSRASDTTVYRIFYLDTLVQGGPVPLQEVEAQIRNTLIEEEVAKETATYTDYLTAQFAVQNLSEMVPEDFTPFILK